VSVIDSSLINYKLIKSTMKGKGNCSR